MSSPAPVKRWALVGLGNPGEQYANSRHNVGFRLIDDFTEQQGWKWKRSLRMRGLLSKGEVEKVMIHALKPYTFMNASGKSIAALIKYLKIQAEQVICIYDDLTLDFGRLKLSIGGSAAGHNGIKDIQCAIGNSFIRFRVGIGSKPHSEMDLKDFVLGGFSAEEEKILIGRSEFYRNSIGQVIQQGPVLAMNNINQYKPNL
ncbi:MAG: aminoacyl-tRNA hydrolase [Opitutales bacterium]|nr:aminoacyl-tRNA hydrolase [Opitutales bacterium]